MHYYICSKLKINIAIKNEKVFFQLKRKEEFERKLSKIDSFAR